MKFSLVRFLFSTASLAPFGVPQPGVSDEVVDASVCRAQPLQAVVLQLRGIVQHTFRQGGVQVPLPAVSWPWVPAWLVGTASSRR